MLSRAAVIASCAFTVACGGSTPTSPPVVSPPPGTPATFALSGHVADIGTMTMTIDFSGRGPLTCKGAGDFTGSVNWTEMTMTAPRISFECGGVYTDVTFALARQQ
jgi:hypothetical protein